MKTTVTYKGVPDSHLEGGIMVVAQANIGGQVLMFNNTISATRCKYRGASIDNEACRLFSKMVRTLKTIA